MNKVKNQKSILGLSVISLSLVFLLMAGVLAGGIVSAENDELVIIEGESTPTEPPIVEISLSPVRQIANEEGFASYNVIIKDNHVPPLDVFEERVFEYALDFRDVASSVPESDLSLSFSEERVSLMANETKIVELEVVTRFRGSAGFVVGISGESVDRYTKGIIVFGEPGNPTNPIPGLIGIQPLFQGQGFILNEDETEGHRIRLSLLNVNGEETLSGKITMGNQRFRIEGANSGDKVRFDVFKVNGKEMPMDTAPVEVASFSGTLVEFERFKLIRGELSDFEGQTWDLTMMSHRKGVITPVRPIAKGKVVQATSVQGILAIQEEAEEDVFIKPIRIRERKILGFIPTGQKEVELEITKENKTFRKQIREHKETMIGGYRISVGPLVDEENIEMGIEKPE